MSTAVISVPGEPRALWSRSNLVLQILCRGPGGSRWAPGRLLKETCPHFSDNVTGARPVVAGIPHGIRPEAVRCKGYRAGNGRVSAGFLQGLARGPATCRDPIHPCQRYIAYRGVSLLIVFYIKQHSLGGASCWQFNVGRHRWLIRSSRGWTRRSTGFESRLGEMFVVEFLHIGLQCSKLSIGLEYVVLSVALCTIKSPWSHSIRVEYSPDFGLLSVAILLLLYRKRHSAIFTLLTLFIYMASGLY